MKRLTAVPYTPGDHPDLVGNKIIGTIDAPAFSFYVDNKFIACAGATKFHDGCAEVWLTPAPKLDLRRYGMEVVYWTKQVLHVFQNTYKIRRLQADVVASDAIARRFVEHYGFVAEGVMRKYDALGRDCIRYARIQP